MQVASLIVVGRRAQKAEGGKTRLFIFLHALPGLALYYTSLNRKESIHICSCARRPARIVQRPIELASRSPELESSARKTKQHTPHLFCIFITSL